MWDAGSNNRAFLWGQASIIQNAISAIRSMEKSNPELARKATLAPPAAGPAARLAPANVIHCYMIWKFSDKIELAKRFLVDLVAAGDDGIPGERVLQSALLSPRRARSLEEARRHEGGPRPPAGRWCSRPTATRSSPRRTAGARRPGIPATSPRRSTRRSSAGSFR